MSAYRRGRALEYRIRDQLRKLGYFVVRSPQSRSPVDLIAMRRWPGTEPEVLFIQAKKHGECGPKEWNALYDLAKAVEATPVLATSPTRGGIVYWLMTGRKDGSRKSPREPFMPGAAQEEGGHVRSDAKQRRPALGYSF